MPEIENLARIWASLPRIYYVRASGDGVWLFWSWEALHETAEIYVCRTDGTDRPRRLTHGQDHYYLRDVNHDGSKAIVAQSRHASEHDQLLLLETQTGILTPLTPAQSDHYVYGGRFSADETWISFIADYDYDNGRITDGGWIWRQDLATGARKALIRTKSTFTEGPEFSPDGSRMLWQRHERAPGGDQLWVMDADGSNAREVLNLGDKARVVADWLDDQRIAFVGQGDGRDRVGVLDLREGQPRILADEDGFNPLEIVTGSNGEFACAAFSQSSLVPVLFDADTGARREFPNRTGRRSALPVASLGDDGWIVEAYDADAPHALYKVSRDGSAQALVQAPPVAGRQFARPRDYRWTSTDGTAVQGWMYQPKGPSRGLVVWVHGGPTWHSEDWVNPKVQFYVGAGYTVLDPNYRGSTGFDARYRDAVKDDGWGGREQDDIRTGIEALIAEGLATRGRIAVIGLSYGGYSSWVAITRFADLVNAAVPICGMYRLDIDYHATEMPHGRDYSLEMMGGTPEDLGEKYQKASPGNFIDHITGGLMIVHGLADSNVGPENTHVAIRELTEKGIPHEAMLFEDEGHGVTKQGNLVAFMTRTADFLERAFKS